MNPALIRFENVTKRFGTQIVLNGVTLDVKEGELLVVIGHSGSGKTTLLRCVNGLVLPEAGRVLVDGQAVIAGDLVELRRRIGYVIQAGGLFPHMTVEQNVALLGRATGETPERRRERAAEVLATVGLGDLGPRYPRELSGGQQQRVGIARGLYADPAIMLLDEPFAAVDPLARMELQDEFARLHRQLHKTMLFVTHDVDEALYLGDRVAVFEHGRLLQVDTPQTLRQRPASDYIARFLRRRAAEAQA